MKPISGALGAALLVVLVSAGCGSAPDSRSTATASTSSAAIASADPVEVPPARAPLDPAERARSVIGAPGAILVGTSVRRSGSRFDVTSLWTRGGGGNRAVTARSGDGFRTTTYAVGRSRDLLHTVFPTTDTPTAPTAPGVPGEFCQPVATATLMCLYPNRSGTTRTSLDGGRSWHEGSLDLEGLLPTAVSTLSANVLGVVAGGDGATLLPFELAARSTDDGESWESFTVPELEDGRGYVSGQVVTTDGELLVLLNAFSGEDQSRTGLYLSDGADWSSYDASAATFDPPLRRTRDGLTPIVRLSGSRDPDPVIWCETVGKRVYVSTDGARTFHETADR